MNPKRAKTIKSKNVEADVFPKEEEKMKISTRKTRTLSISSTSSSASSSTPSPRDASYLIRQHRNHAEKQRRDKLNSYITELALLVPMVARSTKKLDKTSILRLSAAHLRLHQSSLNPKNHKKVVSWRPNIFEAEHLNELLKAIGGFLLVTTFSTKIIFTSKYVENFLGHQDIEMIGNSLFYFLHPDDHEHVRTQLKLSCQKEKKNMRICFCARLRERSQPRSEIINYHMMRFNCSFNLEEEVKTSTPHARRILNARPKKQLDVVEGLLNFYVQPVNLNLFDELSITDAFQDEYVTHHGPRGEILHADHRISTITGHLPHEVIGTLAYDYIFDHDIPVAKFAQRLMFTSSDGRGMIVNRLRTRDTSYVYLKSFGQLQYDKSTMKITHFLCVNKLLSEDEGNEELKKFKEKYSPRISEFLSSVRDQSLNASNTLPMIESFTSQELVEESVKSMDTSPHSLSQNSIHSMTSADSVTIEDFALTLNNQELDLQESSIMSSMQCSELIPETPPLVQNVDVSPNLQFNTTTISIMSPSQNSPINTSLIDLLTCQGNGTEMSINERKRASNVISNLMVKCEKVPDVKRMKFDDQILNSDLENGFEFYQEASVTPTNSNDSRCENQWPSFNTTSSNLSNDSLNGRLHQNDWTQVQSDHDPNNWTGCTDTMNSVALNGWKNRLNTTQVQENDGYFHNGHL